MREDVRQVVVGLLEPDPQRVAIGCFDARDLRVVVEVAGRLRSLGDLVEAHDLAFDEPRPRRADLRIDQALERIRVIGRGQLALLSLERGIVDEVDPLPDPQRVGLAVVGDLGQRLGGERDELRRPREVVVREQRLEERLLDRGRIEILHAGGIEAALRGREHLAHDLRRVRRRERGRRDAGARGEHGRANGTLERRGEARTARVPGGTRAARCSDGLHGYPRRACARRRATGSRTP